MPGEPYNCWVEEYLVSIARQAAEIEKRKIAAGAVSNWIRVARLFLNYAALAYFRSDIRAGPSGFG